MLYVFVNVNLYYRIEIVIHDCVLTRYYPCTLTPRTQEEREGHTGVAWRPMQIYPPKFLNKYVEGVNLHWPQGYPRYGPPVLPVAGSAIVPNIHCALLSAGACLEHAISPQHLSNVAQWPDCESLLGVVRNHPTSSVPIKPSDCEVMPMDIMNDLDIHDAVLIEVYIPLLTTVFEQDFSSKMTSSEKPVSHSSAVDAFCFRVTLVSFRLGHCLKFVCFFDGFVVASAWASACFHTTASLFGPTTLLLYSLLSSSFFPISRFHLFSSR
jgi:hypothetical protein